jgi:hypothetical protein
MTVDGIAENIVAEIIMFLLLAILGWMAFVLTKRAQLLKFYGVHESRRIIIYLSNLKVTPGGAAGIDGQPRSYRGSAVARGEMDVANRIRDLFNNPFPFLFGKPGILNKLLISDIQVELAAPPEHQEQVEHPSSFITLGSPAYNVASAFVETRLQPRAKFGSVSASSPRATETSSGTVRVTTDAPPITGGSIDNIIPPSGAPCDKPPADDIVSWLEWAVEAHSSAVSTVSLEEESDVQPAILVRDVPPIVDPTYAFVERIVDREQHRNVFYVAGLSELGTTGAAHFLATEWLQQHRKHPRDTNFLIVLRINPTDFKRWSIVFER